MDELISKRAAIDALWKALYEYEDKTEKQFQESEDLDVGDWIGHRIFVQNMNDIDRQTILNLPSTQADRGGEVAFWKKRSKEYEDIILRLITEQAKGIKLGSIEITGERIIFKNSQPERKKGKWKLNKDGNWACPFCEFDPYHDNMNGMNYCPNCGADMREESDNGRLD